jgi:hypothetical protein
MDILFLCANLVFGFQLRKAIEDSNAGNLPSNKESTPPAGTEAGLSDTEPEKEKPSDVENERDKNT